MECMQWILKHTNLQAISEANITDRQTRMLVPCNRYGGQWTVSRRYDVCYFVLNKNIQSNTDAHLYQNIQSNTRSFVSNTSQHWTTLMMGNKAMESCDICLIFREYEYITESLEGLITLGYEYCDQVATTGLHFYCLVINFSSRPT